MEARPQGQEDAFQARRAAVRQRREALRLAQQVPAAQAAQVREDPAVKPIQEAP